MKKIISILAACAMMLSLAACSKPAETPADETNTDTATGVYKVYNTTGSKVTEIYLYEVDGEKGENLVADGLKNGKATVLTYDAAADATLVLEFVTEDGYTGTFETLHIEEAPISLLAEDVAAGATPINFFVPEGTGVYTVYNTTGETVTEILMAPAGEESENFAGEGLADGESIELTYTGAIDTVLVFSFTTEGGYTGTFETLHIEEAPISLLAEDVSAGATAISFTQP